VTGVVDINGVGVGLLVDGANVVVVGVSGADGVVLLVGVVESIGVELSEVVVGVSGGVVLLVGVVEVVELSGDVGVAGPMLTVLLVDDDGIVDFSVDLVVFNWSVVLMLDVVLVSEGVVGEFVSVPSVGASVDVRPIVLLVVPVVAVVTVVFVVVVVVVDIVVVVRSEGGELVLGEVVFCWMVVSVVGDTLVERLS